MTPSAKLCLLFCLVFLSLTASAQKYRLPYKGDKRKYIVHLPKGYDPEKVYPLVLNFHGIYMYAWQQKNYCRIDQVADREQFIVVYPQGKSRVWNTGIVRDEYSSDPDDVGFVNALMDTLINRYSVDTTRIYAIGMSLGGFLSYRLACELPRRFAAIASVTGVMSDSTMMNCSNTSGIPVLHIHGTNDHIVKYPGIKSSLGVEETLEFWVRKNGCNANADTIAVPEGPRRDKSCVELIKYTACASGAPVWFYKIHNGGHTWPGTPISFLITGRRNFDIEGSEVVWAFLKQFTLQERWKD